MNWIYSSELKAEDSMKSYKGFVNQKNLSIIQMAFFNDIIYYNETNNICLELGMYLIWILLDYKSIIRKTRKKYN